MRSKAIALAFLLVSSLVAAPKDKTLFEFIEYPGAATTYARGINKAGDISGSWWPDGGYGKGFIRSASGAYQSIEVPGAIITQAWGIDDAGRVVGWFYTEVPAPGPAIWDTRAFIYDRGAYTVLEYPGSQLTQAYGVSAAGVVGYFYSGGLSHGFIYKDGTWTQLDVPGAFHTSASGIAPNGQVVGGADGHGFIYTSGVYTTVDFPRPGTYATNLYGINGLGLILGALYNSCGPEAFLYSRTGKFTLLDLPGSFITGINDSGQVVGIFGTGGKGFVAKASSFSIK